jgi:hypothetical protein
MSRQTFLPKEGDTLAEKVRVYFHRVDKEWVVESYIPPFSTVVNGKTHYNGGFWEYIDTYDNEAQAVECGTAWSKNGNPIIRH